MDDRDTFCRESLTSWGSDLAGVSAAVSAAVTGEPELAGREAMLSLLEDGRTSRMLSGLWDADEDES
jgi:hypothetical protein